MKKWWELLIGKSGWGVQGEGCQTPSVSAFFLFFPKKIYFSISPPFLFLLSWGPSSLLLQWLSSKESTCNVGDVGSTPGSGRSAGGGHGNPLQYSCLENPMDSGAWWATVHGVKELDTTEATQHARRHSQRTALPPCSVPPPGVATAKSPVCILLDISQCW